MIQQAYIPATSLGTLLFYLSLLHGLAVTSLALQKDPHGMGFQAPRNKPSHWAQEHLFLPSPRCKHIKSFLSLN
jgi:hypothetical protein